MNPQLQLLGRWRAEREGHWCATACAIHSWAPCVPQRRVQRIKRGRGERGGLRRESRGRRARGALTRAYPAPLHEAGGALAAAKVESIQLWESWQVCSIDVDATNSCRPACIFSTGAAASYVRAALGLAWLGTVALPSRGKNPAATAFATTTALATSCQGPIKRAGARMPVLVPAPALVVLLARGGGEQRRGGLLSAEGWQRGAAARARCYRTCSGLLFLAAKASIAAA